MEELRGRENVLRMSHRELHGTDMARWRWRGKGVEECEGWKTDGGAAKSTKNGEIEVRRSWWRCGGGGVEINCWWKGRISGDGQVEVKGLWRWSADGGDDRGGREEWRGGGDVRLEKRWRWKS